MTLEQKLKKEYPDLINNNEYCRYSVCPWELGYESKLDGLCKMKADRVTSDLCVECWGREWRGKLYAVRKLQTIRPGDPGRR